MASSATSCIPRGEVSVLFWVDSVALPPASPNRVVNKLTCSAKFVVLLWQIDARMVSCASLSSEWSLVLDLTCDRSSSTLSPGAVVVVDCGGNGKKNGMGQWH